MCERPPRSCYVRFALPKWPQMTCLSLLHRDLQGDLQALAASPLRAELHPASSSQSVPVEGILVTADEGFTILSLEEILVAVILSVAVIAVFVGIVLFRVEVFVLA